MTLINDMTQSSIILGAAIGALSCARFLALGKLKLLYILNIVLLIGVAITMIG
jgi:MFS family permease